LTVDLGVAAANPKATIAGYTVGKWQPRFGPEDVALIPANAAPYGSEILAGRAGWRRRDAGSILPRWSGGFIRAQPAYERITATERGPKILTQSDEFHEGIVFLARRRGYSVVVAAIPVQQWTVSLGQIVFSRRYATFFAPGMIRITTAVQTKGAIGIAMQHSITAGAGFAVGNAVAVDVRVYTGRKRTGRKEISDTDADLRARETGSLGMFTVEQCCRSPNRVGNFHDCPSQSQVLTI
jgi:hypothetical protein